MKDKKMSQDELEANILIATYMQHRVLGKNLKHSDKEPGLAIFKPDEFKAAITMGYVLQFTYHTWEGLMPVVEKLAIDYDIRLVWYNKDCSCHIYNRSIEETELVSFGNFEPAIKNVWMAVVKLIKKEKLI